MNNHKIIVFKTDDGEWQGEVNGDGRPRTTAGYSFVMDPDGQRARAAVLREANAIMTAKTRFAHLEQIPENKDDLATFIRSYQELEVKSDPLPEYLFLEEQFNDEALREGIYGAVLGSDSLGAAIGHTLLSLPYQERIAVVASARNRG